MTYAGIIGAKWFKPACIGFGLLIVLSLTLYTAQCISNAYQRSKLQQSQDKLDQLTNQLDNLNAQTANLKEQEAAKQTEVNIATKELDNAKKETDEANHTVENSLDRVNDIEHRNYNNTSPNTGRNAYCRSHPGSPACR